MHNFVSLRAFTVYMENPLQFEISLQSNWPKWNLLGSKLHFAWTYVNSNNEANLHQSEILPQSEISNQFEFILGLM